MTAGSPSPVASAPAADPAEVRRSLLVGLREASAIAPALRHGLGVTLVLAAVGALGALVVPVLLQQLLDEALLGPGGADSSAVVRRGVTAAAATLVAGVASWSAMFRLVRTAAHGLHELRLRVFNHLQAVPGLTITAERRGALVARVTADVETVTQFIEWGGIGIMVGATQLGVVAILMVVLDVWLASAVLGIAVIYAASLVAAQRVLARRYDRVRGRVAASLAAAGEAISGFPTVRAYGIEHRTAAAVGARLEEQFRTESRTRLLGASLFSTSELFAALMTIAVVGLGLLTAGTTGMTAGRMAAFLLLVTLFVAPVQLLVEVIDQAQAAAAGLRRILGVLEIPRTREPERPMTPPPGPLSLRVTGLDYAYPGGPPILRGIDLDVPAGQTVAVVGRTGSGKSTFVKVIARLQEPAAGTVRLSDVPLEALPKADLRRRVAFVPQDPFLIDGTIAENVQPGTSDVDVPACAAAFAELGLDGWLTGLPDGPATQVGERGGRLSAGERQLVALVRAWVLRADLLILDEATSSIDPTLDVHLREAFARMTDGRTSITVAHRLAAAETADRVLVFEDGRIVEDGAHHSLLAAGGTYARLYARWAVDTGGG